MIRPSPLIAPCCEARSLAYFPAAMPTRKFTHYRLAAALLVLCVPAFANDTNLRRVPWTTSRIHGSPDPAKPYIAKQVYENLNFREVTEIVFDVVSKRWLIMERAGRILSLP